MKFFIKVVDAQGQSRSRAFSLDSSPLKIGRNKAADIPLNDQQCSNMHALLSLKDGKLFIEDLNSKNGVYLNEVLISKQRFYVGDLIKIGKTQIKIDEKKTEPAVLEQLESRIATGITLNLETKEEAKEKIKKLTFSSRDNIANSKLYQGRSTSGKKKPSKFHAVKEALAITIDIFFSIILFRILLVAAKNLFPEIFNSMENESLSAYFQGKMLFITLGSTTAAVLSFLIMRGKGRWPSLGEKLMKLD